VELASFEFEPEQADYLRKQLNNQLKAISELDRIPLDASVEPSLHGVPYPEITVNHCGMTKQRHFLIVGS